MDGQRMLVAIIDNDPLMAELYSLELSDVGCDVRTGNDVESAVEYIAAWKPDLVLLDPYNGNGYRWDVLAEIRDRYVQLPVLICLPFEIFSDDSHVRHADRYVIKSFDVTGLVSKVQALLATKRPQECW